MKKIPLSKGKDCALVDDEDFDKLNRFKWLLWRSKRQRTQYAYRYLIEESGKIASPKKVVYMHRAIMPHDLPHTDHADGDGLNNQKENLRPCTFYQNLANSRNQLYNSSGYKGVSWRPKLRKWTAQIFYNGKYIHLGVFSDVVEAAKEYNRKSVKFWGEFAFLNKVK